MGMSSHNDTPLLAADDLKCLYAGVDWDILMKEDIRSTLREKYQAFSTISLLKSHALPYLLPLPSERALARELAERELLQILCGFIRETTTGPVNIPSRSTLAHFRIKYTKSEVFGGSMLRVLIALVIAAKRSDIKLPFVTEDMAFEDFRGRPHVEFYLRCCRASVQASTSAAESAESDESKLVIWEQLRFPTAEFTGVRDSPRRHMIAERKRQGLADSLGLPARVSVTRDGRNAQLVILQPQWLYVNTRLKDPLISIGPTYLTRPYTACNILVLRGKGSRLQILLSRRLAGFGTGTYTLPGGKKQPHESVQEGAARELKEETGIELQEARPISIHRTHFPGKPPVKSVGVLAEKYSGVPKNQESMQNSEWEWYDLDSLPTPLFGPTELVINDFLLNAFPGLSWRDVEDVVLVEPQHRLPLNL